MVGDCDLTIADETPEAPAVAIAPEVAAILAGEPPIMTPGLPETDVAAPPLAPEMPVAKPAATAVAGADRPINLPLAPRHPSKPPPPPPASNSNVSIAWSTWSASW